MRASAKKPSQRAIENGDTVRLQFTQACGTKSKSDFHVRKNPANPHCWANKLIGKIAGDSVILPEAENNVVHATILSIVRA